MSDDVTVFICKRGQDKISKVQLELRPETLEHFKQMAKDKPKYTAKQYMENILNNYADGTCAT